MSYLTRILVATIISPTIVNASWAQDADSSAVAAVVAEFHQALEEGDRGRVMELLAPEAVVLESGGTESRMEYEAGHLAADIDYAQAASRTRGEIAVRRVGDVAWTVGLATAEYQGNSSQTAELMVLRRDGDRWLISAIHWSSRRSR